MLQGTEAKYHKLGKLAYMVIIFTRNLRPYFQSHTITILIDQPLCQVLQKPKISRRIIKWAIEQGKFDLHFKPHTALKSQVLANFMVECTLNQIVQEKEDATCWELHVDSSSNPLGYGMGLILKGPEEHHDQLEYALRFKFKASNNETEYEALIIRLKLVKEVGVKRLKVFCDSQLVVNQINGDCTMKGAKMILYH